jgi:hypothetical protein
MEGPKAWRIRCSNHSRIACKQIDQQYLMSQGSPPHMKIGGLFSAEYPPLSAHEIRGAILPVLHAQKLSPSINVELVGSLEVFG